MNPGDTRLQQLEARLQAELSPSLLQIENESAKHAGHAGAGEQGGGHFIVSIKAASLEGKSTIARHRIVNAAVADLFGPVIHALSLRFPA